MTVTGILIIVGALGTIKKSGKKRTDDPGQGWDGPDYSTVEIDCDEPGRIEETWTEETQIPIKVTRRYCNHWS